MIKKITYSPCRNCSKLPIFRYKIEIKFKFYIYNLKNAIAAIRKNRGIMKKIKQPSFPNLLKIHSGTK